MTNPHRSSTGCWTCRLRKKKCDETYPHCGVCAALHITCHYSKDRPRWMDNGRSRSEMRLEIKREVRDNARYRLPGRINSLHAGIVSDSNAHTECQISMGTTSPTNWAERMIAPSCEAKSDSSTCSTCTATVAIETDVGITEAQVSQKDADATTSGIVAMSNSESALVACFSDYVLPLVFRAYRPCVHLGSRSWILDLAKNSLVIRNIACFQSSCFFATANHVQESDITTRHRQMSRTVLASAVVTTQVLATKTVQERIHGGLVVLLSILLTQHFGIVAPVQEVPSDSLAIAIKVFEQLLVGSVTTLQMSDNRSFRDLIVTLGPSIPILPEYNICIPNAEQAALNFAITLLLFDDIIASTLLGRIPCLREYHTNLLETSVEPHLEVLNIVGCSSLVLIQISDITVLANWKSECKRNGTLENIELVRQAVRIKRMLQGHLPESKDIALTSICHSSYCHAGVPEPSLASTGRRIWTYAALLYLHIVVFGFRNDHAEVKNNVSSVLDLLEAHSHSQGLLQMVAWPFCVAGCLANKPQQERFTYLSSNALMSTVSGSIRKAEEAMRQVWAEGNSEDAADRDFAYVFQDQTGSPLLF